MSFKCIVNINLIYKNIISVQFNPRQNLSIMATHSQSFDWASNVSIVVKNVEYSLSISQG